MCYDSNRNRSDIIVHRLELMCAPTPVPSGPLAGLVLPSESDVGALLRDTTTFDAHGGSVLGGQAICCACNRVVRTTGKRPASPCDVDTACAVADGRALRMPDERAIRIANELSASDENLWEERCRGRAGAAYRF